MRGLIKGDFSLDGALRAEDYIYQTVHVVELVQHSYALAAHKGILVRVLHLEIAQS